MSYRIINHEMRRTIRLHIEASARKQGFVLSQNTIENLVNRRSKEIGKEMATGITTGFINWDDITKKAHQEELKGQEQLQKISIQPITVTKN